LDNQNKTPASLCNSQPKDTKYNQLPIDFDEKKTGICNISPTEMCEDIKEKITSFSEVEERQNNRFPVDVFPLPFQQIIKATNKDLNFPIDFIGASMLFAASVAIGNTYRAEWKNGWQESAVLYLSLVGNKGTNKSHPLSFALKPIEEFDKINFSRYQKEKKEYEYLFKLTTKDKQQKGGNEPVLPIWKQHIVTDFTPEALVEVHNFNPRGIGVYTDELATWFKNFNRYSKGAEEQFWLSNWTGSPLRINRKGSDPKFLQLPFISVVGTVQPSVLNELAKNRTENGFMDRLLFVMPENLKMEYWSETEINNEIVEIWKSIISRLLDLSIQPDDINNLKPRTLKFSPEARRFLYDWQRKITDISNSNNNETLSGIYAKMQMYAIRLPLIIELMRFACGESNAQIINIESVQAAIELVRYFEKSAIRVNEYISNANPLDFDSSDKKKLYHALPKIFKTDEGVSIANGFNVKERTFKRFLNDKTFFNKLRWGEYEKCF
jgi:hypothetical protein